MIIKKCNHKHFTYSKFKTNQSFPVEFDLRSCPELYAYPNRKQYQNKTQESKQIRQLQNAKKW